MITIDGLSKAFQLQGKSVPALEPLTHGVAAGRFVAVVGPSGCGKSTLA